MPRNPLADPTTYVLPDALHTATVTIAAWLGGGLSDTRKMFRGNRYSNSGRTRANQCVARTGISSHATKAMQLLASQPID